MTNKHKHQFRALVFSSQSHTAIEQILVSSGPVATASRTQSGGAACQSRSHPLDVSKLDISRVSARLPAGQAGEWPHHPMQISPGATSSIRNCTESTTAHNRLSGSIGGRASHHRPTVTLLPFSLTGNSESRANITRPDTGITSHASRHTNKGQAPTDPDNFRKAFTPAKRPSRGVRQDKDRNFCDRSASPQPAAVNKFTRSQATSRRSARSQKKPAHNRRTQPVQVWVHPLVKEELASIAASEGLSLSAAGAAFLERGLQQNVDMRYGALINPVIEKAFAKQMRVLVTRLTWLLVRVAFDAGQTRSLVTNTLGRQPGVTQPMLKTILESSARSAKGNIMRRTPHISQLIEAVEQWMVEDEAQDKKKKTKD